MTSSKIPCTNCACSILPETAAKNDGLCAPCCENRREQLDRAKEEARLHDEYEQSEEWQYWLALVDRTSDDSSLTSLSHAEKLYFALQLLDRAVHIGGFDSYFFNSGASYYAYAVEALLGLGAREALRATTEAKKRIFGSHPVPTDTRTRRAYLRDHDRLDIDTDDLDDMFYEHAKDLEKKWRQFAREHGFFS